MTASRAILHRTREGAAATASSRRRLSRGIASAVALVLATGCLAPVAASADASDRGAIVDSPVGFTVAQCDTAVPESRLGEVSCGALTVPEHRSAGSDPERRLRLPVVVIRSTARDRVTDPLVVPVSVGPDTSSLGSLASFLAGADWVGAARRHPRRAARRPPGGALARLL